MHKHFEADQWPGSREDSSATSVVADQRSVNEPRLSSAGAAPTSKTAAETANPGLSWSDGLRIVAGWLLLEGFPSLNPKNARKR